MTIQPSPQEAIIDAVPERLPLRWLNWRRLSSGVAGFGFDSTVLIFLGLALAGHFGRWAWLLDMTNFFRPHIAAMTLGLIVLALLSGSVIRLAAGVVVLAVAVYPLVFLGVPAAAHVAEGNFRLMTANVLGTNRDFNTIVGSVAEADPDVFIAQEASNTQWRQALASLPGLPYVAGPGLGTSVLVASRYPLHAERIQLPLDAEPDPRVGGGVPMRVEVQRPGGDRPLVIYAIHAPTPRGDRGWLMRNAYLRDIIKRARNEAGRADVIIAGDWNTPSWSPFYASVLNRAGLRATEGGAWPSPTRFFREYDAPPLLGTPIDHVAVSPDIGVARLRVGSDFGSDHLPVVVDLDIR